MNDLYYVATLRLTSDSEIALLRIDIDPLARNGVYSLTDGTGSETKWCWSLTDFESDTFAELAQAAIVAYLSQLNHGSWSGSCAVIQGAFGLDGIAQLVASCLFLHSQHVPEGASLQ